METMAIMLILMSMLTPVLCIIAFIVGYNINAQKKIFKPPAKKHEPTANEIMIDRIDNAQVYDAKKIGKTEK